MEDYNDIAADISQAKAAGQQRQDAIERLARLAFEIYYDSLSQSAWIRWRHTSSSERQRWRRVVRAIESGGRQGES